MADGLGEALETHEQYANRMTKAYRQLKWAHDSATRAHRLAADKLARANEEIIKLRGLLADIELGEDT